MTEIPTTPKGSPSGSDLVECHSGYTYAERPSALRWENRKCIIIDILARWRHPGGSRFRVRVEDGRLFDLYYSEVNDEWQIRIP